MRTVRHTLMVAGLALIGLSCSEGASAPVAVLPLSAVPLMDVQVATPKSGEVIWVNGPGNKGRIEACDGGTYEYNVAAGQTRDGYRPAVGEKVDFVAGPGKVARDVAKRADQDNSACVAACDAAREVSFESCSSFFDPNNCGARDTACQAEQSHLLSACNAAAEAAAVACKENCE
jgi:hypothetical protein